MINFRNHNAGRAPRTYKTPKVILKHLKDYFECNPRNFARYGRCQARAGADDGFGRCALGGIEYLTADDRSFQRACALLDEHLDGGIVYNNDQRGRKYIIAGIDKALAA
jgi:hypothetical protein